MLKLSTAFAIRRDSSPIITPCEVTGMSEIDHRFYGKHVSFLHRSLCLVLMVVRDIRDSVEERADPYYQRAINTHRDISGTNRA